MAKNSVAGLLTSVDDLFSTQESRDEAKLERVINLSPGEISDFPNHPFKVRMDEEMQQMAESVKEHGVLVPALVREKPGGGYEMVAGHRRKRAAELAELPEIPCIVRNLTDDEAIIVMVDSNLQREKILPSEKAFAYKMRLEAMERKQGQRNDLTSANDLQKLAKRQTSRDKVAEKAGKSHETIRLYIRLTYLLPEILDMVDDGKIALRPAVELSYLVEQEQHFLLDTMFSEDCTPSHAQAIKMRKFSQEGNSDPVSIGSYRGFEMQLFYEAFSKEYRVALKGALTHTASLGTDIHGNITRLDNALNGLETRLQEHRDRLENTTAQMEAAKADAAKPFPREQELQEKSKRLAELTKLLKVDEKDRELLDSAPDEGDEQPERKVVGLER